MAKILKWMNNETELKKAGTTALENAGTALVKAGVKPETVQRIENIVERAKIAESAKTVTDPTHSLTAGITKSTIDFIRFGAFPAMVDAGVFPDKWLGDDAG